jgi:hypothetical protein
MEKIRHSYLANVKKMIKAYSPNDEDVRFLSEDSKSTVDSVRSSLASQVETEEVVSSG